MAVKLVPVSPNVVDWAMRESGVTVDEVAEYCKVDSETVEKWLHGEQEPGTTAFRRLATFLGRPTSFFFLAEPPEETGVPPAFRQPPPGTSATEEMTRDESRAIRTARRAQSIAASLREDLEEWPEEVPSVRPGASPDTVAAGARRFLRWSISDQLQAASKSAATRSLRSRIEEAGIIVVHQSMGATRHRGFSLWHERAPLIAVNTHFNAEARSFTYAHEFGHLLRRSDSFCDLEATKGIERWCEEFAASFLLPARPLAEYVQSKFDGQVVSLAEIKTTANHFRVSQSATAIRLSNLDLGPPNLYRLIDRSVDFEKTAGGPATGGLTAPELRLLSFGRSYAELLMSAQEAGALQHHDLLSYLDVTSGQLGSLRTLLASEMNKDD